MKILNPILATKEVQVEKVTIQKIESVNQVVIHIETAVGFPLGKGMTLSLLPMR